MPDLFLVAGSLSNRNGTGFTLANDHAHRSHGITSVSHTDTYVQIDHPSPPGKRITRVVSLTATPDETYATEGITMGASVGLEFSRIHFGTNNPLADYIAYRAGAWRSNNGAFGMEWDYPNECLRLTHPGHAMTREAVALKSSRGAALPFTAEHPGALTSTEMCIQFTNQAGTVHRGPNELLKVGVTRFGPRRLNPGAIVSNGNTWIHGVFEMEDL